CQPFEQSLFFAPPRPPPTATLFPYTTLFRSRAGATPVVVDSDPITWNMDVNHVEASITPQTKAIMVVHIYGLPVDMDPILSLARSEEHTSELQSLRHLVCRLLLEKKTAPVSR